LRLIANTKGLIILDTRSFAQFEGKDTIQSQNIGRIKDAYNVPAGRIKEYAEKFDPKRTYLIYDANGRESNDAAKYLSSNGYANVYHLLGGLSAIIGKDRPTLDVRKELLTEMPAYTILNSYEAINLLLSKKDTFVIDARSKDEFQNKAKEHWQNLGHIKNAVNIQRSALAAQNEELLKHKKDTVVVYGSDAASVSTELKKMGFEHVNLIYGGLWDVVSATYNIKSLKEAKSLLVNHHGLY
jgi:rhodanese-related sulfurtransferase